MVRWDQIVFFLFSELLSFLLKRLQRVTIHVARYTLGIWFLNTGNVASFFKIEVRPSFSSYLIIKSTFQQHSHTSKFENKDNSLIHHFQEDFYFFIRLYLLYFNKNHIK